MQVAIVIYDGFNLANLATFCDRYHELKAQNSHSVDLKICAFKSEIKSKNGVVILPSQSAQSLYGYDELCVVGGDISEFLNDQISLSWLRSGSRCTKVFGLDEGKELLKEAKFESILDI